MWRDRRVVHLVSTGSVGGAENQVLFWARDQVINGAIVWYVALKEEPSAASVRRRCHEAAIRYVNVGADGHALLAWARIAVLLRRVQPHCLHCHLPRAIGYGALLPSFQRGLIRLATLHNVDPKLRRWPWRVLYRILIRRFHGVSGISHAVADFVTQTLQMPRHAIGVTTYGVGVEDGPRAQPEARLALACGDRSPVLVTIGRLTRQKNQEDFIRVIHALRPIFPNLLGIIVGRDEGRGQRLRCLAQELDVQMQIRIEGFSEQPRRYLESADLFVFPSLWEGLGLVLLEAMAVGVPIVAYENAAVLEALARGDAGAIVPAGDLPALVDACRVLLESQSARQTLVARASAWLLREYNPEMSLARLNEWARRSGVAR